MYYLEEENFKKKITQFFAMYVQSFLNQYFEISLMI